MASPLHGKRIVFLGSSVTYGAASGGVSFPELLARDTGCEIVKEAVSGTTLVDLDETSYVARLRRMDASRPASLFVCQLSTNDATRGLPLGRASAPGAPLRTDTVAGALETIVDYARETWHCPVAAYTNPRYNSEPYAAMVDLLGEISRRRGFEVIDLWHDEAFNALTPVQRARYMADPIHPTLEGYEEWWLPVFRARLESMI